MRRVEEMYLTSENQREMKSEKRAGGECLKKGVVGRIFQKNQIP